jgi:hypothetical protein
VRYFENGRYDSDRLLLPSGIRKMSFSVEENEVIEKKQKKKK